jgi:DNA (cytosine-5)-methyltransferase 1
MEAIAYLIGAGSMTLGVEAAGFNVREVWETPGYGINAQTWDLNRPAQRHHILHLDHTNHTFFSARGSVDMIFGNPPCGGLSSMTCSRIESPTNNCMRQWIRMVAPAQPRMILMENAYQLATDRMRPLLDDLTGVLDDHGYWWWTWTFYSYQVGTPQIRRRMFLCATRDKPVSAQLLLLEDLPNQGKATSPVWPWLWDLADVAPSPGPVATATGAVVEQHYYHREDVLRVNELVNQHVERLATPYWTTKDYEKLLAAAADGDENAKKQVQKNSHLHWPDCPKDFGGMSMHRPHVLQPQLACGAIIGAYRYVHPTARRMLTFREMCRLMGYPDTWNFHEMLPHLIAQGIPVNNSFWAADRMLKVIGLR